jgi:sugar-specific transcriptional regulator TrmB
MDKIKSILKQIGLTSTETDIYLAGLNYLAIGVSEIEKQTKIKRTTIYHAINTLMQKGLVAKKGTGNRLMFSMTKPDNISRLINKDIELLQEKQKELKELLPLLNQRIAKQDSGLQVSHYEGIEGVKLVIEEALYCKSRHWDILAPTKNFFSDFDKNYAKYFIQTRKQRGITARSLWEYDFSRRALTPEELNERQPRFLPKAVQGKFKSVIILFDDKVALISSVDELSAILIQSSEIYNTMLIMFEGLWSSSEKYTEIKKVKS